MQQHTYALKLTSRGTADGPFRALWYPSAMAAERAFIGAADNPGHGSVELMVAPGVNDYRRVAAVRDSQYWGPEWTAVAYRFTSGARTSITNAPQQYEAPNLYVAVTPGRPAVWYATSVAALFLPREGRTVYAGRTVYSERAHIDDLVAARNEWNDWEGFTALAGPGILPVPEPDPEPETGPSLDTASVPDLLRALADRLTDWERRGGTA